MFVGLDLGTSGLKGVVVDECGQIRASHTLPLAISRPRAGWSEQQPTDWIAAAGTVLSALASRSPAKIRAIGLSGQMHGATCIDSAGKVIRPAILWNDVRAERQAGQINTQTQLKTLFGNIVFPGFTAPKIAWMHEHEPQLAARIHKVLLPKDYLRYWLSGEYATDMSDASGTAWLAVGTRRWSNELLAATRLDRSHMPQLVEGNALSAKVCGSVAAQCGIPINTPIAGGAGDNAASAIGLGITAPAKGCISLGTSGVVFVANRTFRPNPDSAVHTFCHAVPATWHQMGVTLSATDSLNWWARQCATPAAELIAACKVTEKPGAEIFLPFLGGERTPYNCADLRAGFCNIDHQSDRTALTRSVLEGVCFSLRESVELMDTPEQPVDSLQIVGGGARSSTWVSLLATVLGCQLTRPDNAEHTAAIGAARLGALAIGEDFPLAATARIFDPQHNLVAGYTEKYHEYLRFARQRLGEQVHQAGSTALPCN